VTIKMGMRRLAHFGMGLVLATGLAATAQTATHTTMTAETREVSGKTVATFTTSVLDADGAPASGIVTLTERGRNISAAVLDAEGKAQIKLDGLTEGNHSLSAVYSGDSAHAASKSESLAVHPEVTATPDFTLGIAPTSLSVKVGTSGTIVTTITPVNSFTGFISLSCAGPPGATTLPVGVTCTFAPANLQVIAPTTANPTAVATANMSLQTAGPQAQNHAPETASHNSQLVLAVLLPGVLGLGLLGRKRKLVGGATLLIMIGAISLIGATACSARYRYLNHGPTFGGTAPGTYTIQVIAQTSNGVTASEHVQTVALTVTN
jgi:hypothetical protein